MNVIARKALIEHWKRYPDSEQQLRAWYWEAKRATWKSPAEVKEQYGSASVLGDRRIVFNICGNKYRLVVKINYRLKTIFIRFVDTHKEYDSIDAEMI